MISRSTDGKSTIGSLIVLEGIDGSGKSTLAQKLVEKLNHSGIDSIYCSFPGHTPRTLGRHVHQLHHDAVPGVQIDNATSLQLLHVAAHIEEIEARVIPALRQGQTVILDRYWWSTWAYGLASGVPKRRLRSMIRLEKSVWGKTEPSRIFVLHRDCEERSAQSRVEATYRDLAADESGTHKVIHINNDGSVTDAVEAMVSILESDTHRQDAPTEKQRVLQFDVERTAPQEAPTPNASLAPLQPTIVFDTYWRFAVERQAIFYRRFQRHSAPWTEDPILAEYKFTNAYRASDRVSQYLIRNVIHRGDADPREVFFRTLLFKVFNKIETWELLQSTLETINYSSYSFERYDSILTQAIEAGTRIYSAAYIMPTGGKRRRKHRLHLELIDQMVSEDVPERLCDCPTMKEAFDLLRSYPTIGDFLAYQYVTDLNYSDIVNFSETEFVVAGPGAKDGIRKCFSDYGGLNESEIIRLVAERQVDEFANRGLEFQSLWGRPLQLIDCQNLFCEVDKYSRVRHPEMTGKSGRTRIKQKYSAVDMAPIDYWYPPKWGLNDAIASGAAK